MKKLVLLLVLVFALASTASLTSCKSQKAGCPAYESASVKTNKKGKLPKKRGKSNLFPKGMRNK